MRKVICEGLGVRMYLCVCMCVCVCVCMVVRVSGSAVCDVFVYLIMCVVYNLLLYRSEY